MKRVLLIFTLILASMMTAQESTQLKAFKSKMGIEFVPIPAGEFMMGCSKGDNECNEESEESQHKVQIAKGFYIGKYEITQSQWEGVMGGNPSHFNSCGGNCPVEKVSWNDIQAFLSKLNEKENRTGDRRMRLPTAAEWEYAARAGTSSKTYATDLDSIAWYRKNSGLKTHPVGEKQPNSFRLYDMFGNVWEWVDNLTDEKISPNQTRLELRGGSWNHYPDLIRASSRLNTNVDPSERYYHFGFRLVAPGT